MVADVGEESIVDVGREIGRKSGAGGVEDREVDGVEVGWDERLKRLHGLVEGETRRVGDRAEFG
jgi:hypothetical protein